MIKFLYRAWGVCIWLFAAVFVTLASVGKATEPNILLNVLMAAQLLIIALGFTLAVQKLNDLGEY